MWHKGRISHSIYVCVLCYFFCQVGCETIKALATWKLITRWVVSLGYSMISLWIRQIDSKLLGTKSSKTWCLKFFNESTNF